MMLVIACEFLHFENQAWGMIIKAYKANLSGTLGFYIFFVVVACLLIYLRYG